MITPLVAARAYAAAQTQGADELTGGVGLAGGPAAASGPSFGDVLKGVMTDAVQASKHAETQVVAGVQGKADLVDVVTALSSAETSLQTLVSVRDQVISAYKEIMAMQI